MKIIILLAMVSVAFSKSLTVSILPQKYFVEQIAGDNFEVNVMVKPGSSPETYEPTPKQMIELSKSHAFLAIDVPFEKIWLPKISENYPDLKIFDTSKGVQKRSIEHFESIIEVEEDVHHDCENCDHEHEENHHELDNHEHHEGHNHGGENDPHIWLAPEMIKIQAENIKEALISIDPSKKEFYIENTIKFKAKLDELSKIVSGVLTQSNVKSFMVFHPSWGYFADQFKIKQIPVEVEGKSPSPGQLKEIIDLAKKKEIKIVFVQPQFDKRSAETIAKSINGKVLPLNPLEENLYDNLLDAANKIAGSMK
ncbi:MAG: zinc ABC transporter substrate-binding protein [Candidatus Delongbacteria bacterium]|nr:zinc ABC transporter substrate-binding protein [Candidatus Delongbacteria bacterium]MBN2836031.1 zinc ABC transporter substrate-binding protein [Candidatus Delongbacteria bacterium]